VRLAQEPLAAASKRPGADRRRRANAFPTGPDRRAMAAIGAMADRSTTSCHFRKIYRGGGARLAAPDAGHEAVSACGRKSLSLRLAAPSFTLNRAGFLACPSVWRIFYGRAEPLALDRHHC
jgi:hypothetical protein